MSSEDTPNQRLGFELDTDNPEFIRGFEVGALNARLRIEEDTFSQMISAASYEMLRRMADAAGRLYRADLINDKWMNVTVYPRGYVIKKSD